MRTEKSSVKLFNESAPDDCAEQFLLFDHTEYLVGVRHIGTIAISELIPNYPRVTAVTYGQAERDPFIDDLNGIEDSLRLF